MPSLPEHIAAVIASEARLWFPGLATELAARFADAADRRWVENDYGTARWLAADPAAAREVVAAVRLGGVSAIIERLDPRTQRRFGGLPFIEPTPAAKAPLEAATTLLARIPGLDDLLIPLVRTIHILSADPGYDISHSDPDLPFSIFVSLPEPSAADGVARLAESVLHEALHLQLTLIEAHGPLVAEPQRESYSPWKMQPRPFGGLLHGLYVFGGISQALADLAPQSAMLSAYAARRRREIAGEVRALGACPEGLTANGRRLWARAVAATA